MISRKLVGERATLVLDKHTPALGRSRADPFSVWVDHLKGISSRTSTRSRLTLAEKPRGAEPARRGRQKYDMRERHLDIQASCQVLIENQQKGNYKLVLDTAGIQAPTMRHRGQPELTATAGDRQSELRTVDFRRALWRSGIDRDQINEAFWLGTRRGWLVRAARVEQVQPRVLSIGRSGRRYDLKAGERAAGQGGALRRKDPRRVPSADRQRSAAAAPRGAWRSAASSCSSRASARWFATSGRRSAST